MFGTGVIAALRRGMDAVEIARLRHEIEELRNLDRSRSAELFTLKAVVAVLVLEFPQFRHRLREVLDSGDFVDPTDPLYPGVKLACDDWRDVLRQD